MTHETQYPWPVKTPTSLSEIRIGDAIPATAETPGPCPNCHDADGLMFAHFILPGGGKIHWIEDTEGERKMIRAELISGPCPTCRPSAKVAELPELPDIGNLPEYLHR